MPFVTAGSYPRIISWSRLLGSIHIAGTCCDSSTDTLLPEAAGPRDVGLCVLDVELDALSVLTAELDALSEDLILAGSVGVADLHDPSDAVVELPALPFSKISSSFSVFV